MDDAHATHMGYSTTQARFRALKQVGSMSSTRALRVQAQEGCFRQTLHLTCALDYGAGLLRNIGDAGGRPENVDCTSAARRGRDSTQNDPDLTTLRAWAKCCAARPSINVVVCPWAISPS